MVSPARRSDWAGTPVEATRLRQRIEPRVERVAALPFPHGGQRLERIASFVDGLAENEAEALLEGVIADFGARHHDLVERFEAHAEASGMLALRFGATKRLLLGAYSTQEYAVEAAAITNPSMVVVESRDGEVDFILSMRAIGEGHISSVRFRSGTFSISRGLELVPENSHSTIGSRSPIPMPREKLIAHLDDGGVPHEQTEELSDLLEPTVTSADLELTASQLGEDSALGNVIELAKTFTGSNYRIGFERSDLSSRVIMPAGQSDLRGIEDARFVRVESPQPLYMATYTGYDGFNIVPQLLTTPDFVTFELTTMSGKFARNKGMALFPRSVAGSYVALTRHDQNALHVAWSTEIDRWTTAEQIAVPAHAWDMVQIGNCGSPIETPEGWLVLLHGVGPMRRYVLSAMLLDLDDPSVVLGTLQRPLLEPVERDGYVPNVVYSCGGIAVDDTLLIPFGIADRSIGFATVSIAEIYSALV